MQYVRRSLRQWARSATAAWVLCAGAVVVADTAHLDEVRSLLEDGRYADAVRVSERNAAAIETTEGRDSLEYAEALDLLVEARRRNGIFMDPETRRFGAAAVAIKESRLGSEHPAVARSLTRWASALRDRGDYAEAIEAYERALRIETGSLGPDDARLADTLHAYGLLRALTFDFGARDELLERALAIREKTLGPDDPITAETMCDLGAAIVSGPERERGLSLIEHGLVTVEARYRGDHPVVGRCTAALATAFAAYGEHAEAARSYKRAVEIQESLPGTGRYRLVPTFRNLAISQIYLGELEEARIELERAEALAVGILGPDHRETAMVCNTSGVLLRLMGDYAASRRMFERAERIAERLGPAREGMLAYTWLNLAYYHTVLRETADAEMNYGRGLPIAERRFGEAHRWTLLARLLYGELLWREGKLVEARDVFTRSLEIRRRVFGPDYHDLAMEFTGLGLVSTSLGEYGAAIENHLQALAIRRAHLGPMAPDAGWSLQYLSQARLGAGDFDGALRDALESERTLRENLLLTMQTLSGREAMAYQSTLESRMSTVLQAASEGRREEGEALARAFDALIRSRAVVLDEMASRHRAYGEEGDEAATRLVGALEAARGALARLAVGGGGERTSADYLRALDAARERKEEAERALARHSVEFHRQRARRHAGFQQVLASLQPDEALVSYVLYEAVTPVPPDARTPARTSLRSVPSFMAVVLPAGSRRPELVPLGPAEAIAADVSMWRTRVAAKPIGLKPALGRLEREYRAAGESLRRRIWDPIAKRLEGARLVLVVPDGVLHLVSLATLPVGQDRYLLESGPTFHYLSAERDLVRVRPRTEAAPSLLALGGANFDGEPGVVPRETLERARVEPVSLATSHVYRGPQAACGDSRLMEFKALPGSVKEVEQVGSLWRDAGGPKAARILTLTGAAANEAMLKRAAPHYSVLHLATHGFFVDDRCGAGPSGRSEVSPLLRSGLALAGANRRHTSGPEGEDGILTAEEIASLDLTAVDLAVLSACGTGLGEIEAGEGVFGLRRAFEVAGARALITSLWPVEDQTARAWMTELYTSRARGLPIPEAVRQASLTLLEARREAGKSTHPFHWGAFVGAGDRR